MSEDEGKPTKAQKKAGKQQKGRAWLKEGEDDDPLNFLDPKVSQRVLGKRCFELSFDNYSCIDLSRVELWSSNGLLLFFSHQPRAEKEHQG